MDVVYAWSKGAKFIEICKMTDIFEGMYARRCRCRSSSSAFDSLVHDGRILRKRYSLHASLRGVVAPTVRGSQSHW